MHFLLQGRGGNLLEIADCDFCLARLTVSGAA
jgi:hypothetical protein